jgi:predicted amidohydrolase YtcJ
MIRMRSLVSVVTGSLLAVAANAVFAQAGEAELILSGGDILVPGGWAQSLAVKGGVIVAVGDDASVAAYRGPKTQVIDLAGAAVVPGLHDLHVHAIGSGEQRLRCGFPQGSSAQVVAETIKGCVAKRKPGDWITGGQWDAASFGDTTIDREFLDKIAPDNPVALNDISMHAVWLNTAALKLARITKDTPAPSGGVIERRADGEPTGVLREGARALTAGLMPPPTIESQAEAIKWSQHEMLQYGITAFTDAGVSLDGLKAYALVADGGELKQRVRGCLAWRMIVGERCGGVGGAAQSVCARAFQTGLHQDRP